MCLRPTLHGDAGSRVSSVSRFRDHSSGTCRKIPSNEGEFSGTRRRRIELVGPPVVLPQDERRRMSLLYIILIVVLVLVLLGFVGRGRY